MTFKRAYRLTVGDILLDASAGVEQDSLRLVFRVERDAKRQPNDVQLEIYNLNPAHRAGLAQLADVPILLEAGYAGELGTIFLGDLRSSRTVRRPPEYVTTVAGGDGENKIRIAKLTRSWVAGTPVGSVIQELAEALGVEPGNVSDFSTIEFLAGTNALTRPFAATGAVWDSLDRVCRSCGLAWSIQDNTLQINIEGLPTSTGDREGPLLTPDTGLIGSVEAEVATETDTAKGVLRGQTVYTGVSLLRSDILPGRPIRVESEDVQANLVVRGVTHSGDSHGGDWVTQWTAVTY